ncbi:MAG TPA: hypothetical protein VF832_05955 [Longimicrobiales bacterium]
MRGLALVAPLLLFCASAGAAQQMAGGAAGVRAAGTRTVDATSLRTQDCLKCHALPNLGYREAVGARARVFTVAPRGFQASAHGKLECVQCHADMTAYPHVASTQRKRVTCDADCHAVDAAGRPYTHRSVAAQFAESVHGRAVRGAQGLATAPDPDAPTCLTCHGSGDAHMIAPKTSVTRETKVALCVRCHDNRTLMAKHRVPVDAVASYRRSFHYKSLLFGGTGTAICIDCHTAHHVLPASDPRSSVATASLTKTCGQARCHEGARRNFAVSGANHLDLRVDREPVLWFEEKFFLVLTGGTMLMLLVGIILDVQRKFGWGALAARAGRALGGNARRLRPTVARSGRRGLRLARRILID